MTQQNTHPSIDAGLVGTPTELAPGRATVELTATEAMAADALGLVHGGFTFGLADYAAMLAVNDPHVVLGKASTRFLAPVRVGATMVAQAAVQADAGKKRVVHVAVTVDDVAVFDGEFTCYVLDAHVLTG